MDVQLAISLIEKFIMLSD